MIRHISFQFTSPLPPWRVSFSFLLSPIAITKERRKGKRKGCIKDMETFYFSVIPCDRTNREHAKVEKSIMLGGKIK